MLSSKPSVAEAGGDLETTDLIEMELELAFTEATRLGAAQKLAQVLHNSISNKGNGKLLMSLRRARQVLSTNEV